VKNSEQNVSQLHLVRISRLDDAFSVILELEASPVECQQLQQKDNERRKRKGEKKIKKPKSLKTKVPYSSRKLSQNLDLFTCPRKKMSQNAMLGKKGTLSCRKCLFWLDWS